MKFWLWLNDLVLQFISYFNKTDEKKEPAPVIPLPSNPNVLPAPRTMEEYEAKFRAAKVNDAKIDHMKAHCAKIMHHQAQYQKVQDATGVPWFIVACIHSLEGSLNFGTHLHNGDSLTARTVRVPAGRPRKGNPPFEWFESAIDALGGEDSHKKEEWRLGYCLQYLERYNGLGYQKKNIPSPYLWSFTNQYIKGKYVADGKFDANAVSKQAGAVAILKTLGVFI